MGWGAGGAGEGLVGWLGEWVGVQVAQGWRCVCGLCV